MDEDGSLLSLFFNSLQRLDPTNYIPLDPEEPVRAPERERQERIPEVPQGPTGPSATPPAGASRGEDAPSTPRDFFPCPICLETRPISTRVSPGPCSHGSCSDCLQTYLRHAAEARRAPVSCPECEVYLNGPACIRLLSGDAAKRLGAALAENAAGPLMYCSNSACKEPFSTTGEDRETDFHCPFCATSTCTLCGTAAHTGRECPSGHVSGSDDELLAQLAARKGWTRCPGCGTLASRDSSWSCNYCVCLCGVAFCIRCGARYLPRQETTGRARGQSGRARGLLRNLHGTPTCRCGLYQR